MSVWLQSVSPRGAVQGTGSRKEENNSSNIGPFSKQFGALGHEKHNFNPNIPPPGHTPPEYL